MTEKQKRFCEEYLVDLNETQAAVRAGYSEKTAYSIGSENLKKPEIKKYLQELRLKQSERTGLTADDVINELREIAFTDGVEISGKEKIKALELLGKHLGIFTEHGSLDELPDKRFLPNPLETVLGAQVPRRLFVVATVNNIAAVARKIL